MKGLWRGSNSARTGAVSLRLRGMAPPAFGTPPRAFSPDGSRLLANAWGTFSLGGSSSLCDVAKGTEIAKLTGYVSDTLLDGVFFSHDGRRIASVSLDGAARLWDGTSGRLDKVLGQ